MDSLLSFYWGQGVSHMAIPFNSIEWIPEVKELLRKLAEKTFQFH